MILYLNIYSILNCLCTGNPKGSDSTTPESEPSKDNFKTTFDGDKVNLDINCRQGYNKFNCFIENTRVKYQSEHKFVSVKDDDRVIWEDKNKPAFRVFCQFLDNKPLTVSVEFSDQTVKNFGRKYATDEWEELDGPTYKKRVEDFLGALEKHKDEIKKYNDEAIDLDLEIKDNDLSFEIHKYRDNDEKVSPKTVTAKSNNEAIDKDGYTVKMTSVPASDSTGPLKNKEIEMKPKYRIVKIRYDPGALSSTKTVWETGGTYYCVKVVAKGKDKLNEFILDIVSSNDYKRYQYKYEYKENRWYQLSSVNLMEEKMLPTIDFKY